MQCGPERKLKQGGGGQWSLNRAHHHWRPSQVVGPHIGVDVLEVLLTKVMIIKSAKVLPHNSKVVLTQIYTPPAQTTHNITEHSHTRSLVQKHNICWWWWSECWWKWKKGGMRCWPGAPVMIILMGSALSQRQRNLLEEIGGNSFHRNHMKSVEARYDIKDPWGAGTINKLSDRRVNYFQ